VAETLFRRLVVSLAPESDGRSADAAIEFARRLEAHLTLLVVQDELMLQAVALPFVNEIDLHSGAWRTIDADAVMRHWAGTTQQFVRRMTERLERAGIAGDVRVSRDAPGAALGAACEPGDLVLLIEPSDPLARIARPFVSDLAAALGGERDVLFAPHGASPRDGPIAALPGPSDRRCAAIASRIAELTGRRLMIIEPPQTAAPAGAIQRALDAAPAPARESLIVMTRGAFGVEPAQAFALAAARGAPLLLLVADAAGASSTDTRRS
jgi:hypothetical protein